MATITNKSGSPRILNTEQGPFTLQPGADLPEGYTLSDNEAAAIKRFGILDEPSDEPRQPVFHDMAAQTGTSGGDVVVTDEDRAFAEELIKRNVSDITDEEIAALTPGQRQAVIEAENDREKPRSTLIAKLEQATA